MKLAERDEGDYRIYMGSLEGPQGDGYIAAVVVNRVRGTERAPREVFRDESLACGHRWPSSDAALSYALSKARKVIRTEPRGRTC
ncbi:hypothetical protein [Piscinibacter sp.]|jgi:hypothetical protein|uniref:hypothetical protein n=1 Tax=Piscinibacter sp. TaxID=1903157 RepID=UPI00355A0DD1